MNIKASYTSYKNVNSFSKLVIDYVNESEHLKQFIHEFPTPKAIQNQIERKEKQTIDRKLLQDVLIQQYRNLNLNNEVAKNISSLLDENTFTICTAHQPNIFTGYLYFIYKIIHAIKLATECNKLFPSYQFVPIYYMGSEDNDIEEIGTFHYAEKTFTWNTSQSGACGRMKTKELMGIVHEIKNTLNESNDDEAFLSQLLETAYDGKNTLTQATRIIVNGLFGKYGLLVVDGDDIALKKQFTSVIKQEILEQHSHTIVTNTIAALSPQYKVQANPRPINLFYLKENIRERIEKVDNIWHVINTDISFSQNEIEQEIELHPDRFSPNVILRPLYQESILPNIAFIGGGGELGYWLELKVLFEHHQIVYPIIFLRNSVLWLQTKTNAIIEKLSLNLEEIFLDKEEIFKLLIHENVTIKTLDNILQSLKNNYKSIIELGATVSPTLEQSMKAHTAKARRIEERIVQKFKAQLKKQDETIFNKIETIQQQIAPNETLQERHDNFLSIYKIYGLTMFDLLLEYQSGFGKEFLIMQELENT